MISNWIYCCFYFQQQRPNMCPYNHHQMTFHPCQSSLGSNLVLEKKSLVWARKAKNFPALASRQNKNRNYPRYVKPAAVTHHIGMNFYVQKMWGLKGQIISKWLFGVFNFLQKTNENKSTWCFIDSSKVECACLFFGGNVYLKKSFWLLLTFR